MTELWTRSYPPVDGRTAHLMLLAFGAGAPPAPTLTVGGESGIPNAESVAALDIRLHQRGQDPDWFDGWRTGSLRVAAGRDLETLPDPTAPTYLHSRGMRKFARPDVVALVRPQDANHAARVCNSIAEAMALGFLPGHPRQSATVSGRPLTLAYDDGAVAQRLALDNDAVVILDADGRHLAEHGWPPA